MLYGKEIANDEKINSCFIHVIDFQIILRILHIFCDLTLKNLAQILIFF